MPAGEPQTILLLGSDHRYGESKGDPPRSDTIIVVRLDPGEHATAVMSIPRDLEVNVPGHGSAKINAAFGLGGAKLTIATLQTLGIDVSHVVSVEFGGFVGAVNRLGCVYADVDRRYFNDHGGPGGYAVINLKPGYQKLCGGHALDYVRYRHTDSDFVRAARQQAFLSQAKDQIGLGTLIKSRKDLLRIFGRYTQTDIADKDTAQLLGLLKLVYESTKTPIAQVPFPHTDCPSGSCVEISDAALRDTVRRFEEVRGQSPSGGGTSKRKQPKSTAKRVRRKAGLAPGLVTAQREGEDDVLSIDLKLRPRGLPVLFPKARLGGAGADYVQGSSPRSYEIFDRARHSHRAYRIVLSTGLDGEYYGVQGTTWMTPPILDDPTDSRRIGNRRSERYFDGHKIKLLAWRSARAVYWVSNTLSGALTNRQMTDIAGSLREIGR
ncbi:MAG TPA: LCP family protein [Solirubrobacteraceae bacterium]